MGAVDRTVMMLSSTDCVRKTKLFFHIVDLCLLNSHALYLTQNPEKVPLATFQLNLIRQLLENSEYIFLKRGFISDTIYQKVTPVKPTLRNPERLMGRHFPALVPDNKVRRCTVCSKTKTQEKKKGASQDICAQSVT
ncbi:hypothetical protein NQ318_004690 [Aromia moschata]|uniref:PiggyBac transposable element-derived protein domain-containing protein n=1 Tax=Aromia moschata TaxID=1265417 RepID=A0AAV8X572_9CUCU|nr:hypothetical protein NQ318_004690 [Aromia moschata]